MLASSSKLSATIRAFSFAVHRRRRRRPVITSTRRYPPSSCLASSMAFAIDHLQRSAHADHVAGVTRECEVGAPCRLRSDGVALSPWIDRDGIEFANVEWSRKNREAGRPFIDHQLAIMDFYVALQVATRDRDDLRLIHPDEIIAASPEQTRKGRSAFALRVKLSDHGTM